MLIWHDQKRGNIKHFLQLFAFILSYSGLDFHAPGYRKNVTKETTGPLKAWLQDHRKNPYPTKAEKIMLAIITKMTLTQVSTWFANARRRLKKETGRSSPEVDEDGDGRSEDEAEGSDASRSKNGAWNIKALFIYLFDDLIKVCRGQSIHGVLLRTLNTRVIILQYFHITNNPRSVDIYA